MVLSNDAEGVTPLRAIAEYRKVVIQGRGAFNPQPAHHRKARAVHNREVLILPIQTYLPGRFQIGRANGFDCNRPVAQFFPKFLRNISPW
jgi:hypothetical protein